MEKIDWVDYKITQDERFITLSILDTIDINTLKRKLNNYLEQKYVNLLDYLISEDGKIIGKSIIVMHRDNDIFEQFNKNRFIYIYLGDKELLINRKEGTYLYSENDRLFSSREMKKDEKAKINPKICDIFTYLQDIHDNNQYNDVINFLYHEVNIVDETRVLLVTQDDQLALIIPNFYQKDATWMKMMIVLKQTKEIIGSVEFNFRLDSDNFYDYKGNVSYEIRDDYRGCGYATTSLELLRKYLRDLGINKELYVSTEVNNMASQRVAIKNTGILCYEGEVPKNSIVSFLGKVDKVKIYRISNM